MMRITASVADGCVLVKAPAVPLIYAGAETVKVGNLASALILP